MSETWAIAIGTGVLSIMTMLLGWMATSISGLRKDLKAFVLKEDCNRAMDGHCADIKELKIWIAKNSDAIARLETRLNTQSVVRVGQ